MGQWYLKNIANGEGISDAAFVNLQLQEKASDQSVGNELLVFQQPEIEFYQQLVELSRDRLMSLGLEYGVEKSREDSIRSKLFTILRQEYQKRDRLRLLVKYRKVFIERLLSEGEESAEATTDEYQQKTRDKDEEYDSTAASLQGK